MESNQRIRDLIQLRGDSKSLDDELHFQMFDFYTEDKSYTEHNYNNGLLHPNVIQYFENDDSFDDEDSDDESQQYHQTKKMKVFSMKIFGVNNIGETVCVNINDFTPSFYIRIPHKLQKKYTIVEKSIRDLMKQAWEENIKKFNYNGNKPQYVDEICSITLVKKHRLYWFDDNKEYMFFHIRFKNMSGYYSGKRLFLDQFNRSCPIKLTTGECIQEGFEVYDGNIEPMLRFFHTKNILPAAWLRIPKGKYTNVHPNEKETTCNYEITCRYRDVVKSDCKEVSPYVTASFDIECDSWDGDFPLAKKSYRKYARKIVEMYLMTKQKDESFTVEIQKLLYTVFGIQNLIPDLPPARLKKNQRVPTSQEIQLICIRIYEILRSSSRETVELDVCSIMNRAFPKIEGDFITMIGTTFRIGREKIGGYILTLGECAPVPGSTVVACKTEKEMISRWFELIRSTDPDIITGYNINGFDYDYIFTRMTELEMAKNDKDILYPGLGRVRKVSERSPIRKKLNRLGSRYKCDKMSSAAMGVMENKYFTTFGRINMDLMKVIRKTYMSLESYKLDSIAASFMNGKIKRVERIDSEKLLCEVDSVNDFTDNMYISCTNGKIWMSGKRKVYSLNREEKTFIIHDTNIENDSKYKVWKKAKDDVPPQEIFRLQRGNNEDRGIVAKYCIQDCNLVLDIDAKVENIAKAQAMANVCCVPLSYIFSRGQGIKLASLVFKECFHTERLIKVLPSYSANSGEVDGYEGAVVLEPKTGLYLDKPVSVLDYSSLYPSSIISENISHDSIVWIKDFDMEGNYIDGSMKGDEKYDNLEGYNYVDIEYDRQGYREGDERKNKEKIKIGTRVCRFAQPKDQSKSTIPNILMRLLAKRKETKKLMKAEKDPFKYNLLDAEQLAYKVTANSLYGQMGAKTSKICFIALAACTTAYGRKLLNYAKEGIEELYGKGNDSRCDAEYVYGDTDSVFVAFNPKGPDGELLKGKEALDASIKLAVEAEGFLSNSLKKPHCLEYEKTFMPFVLLSKKRYVGEKYEFDLNKSKQTNMGVVLKRRDNAPIVKEAYGKMIDVLMKEKSVDKTVSSIQTCLSRLINGEYGIEYLTITKSLRDNYADPTRIAHKALADRIGVRDPGNKPKANDRIGFVYIDVQEQPGKKILQGDRVETPEFIRENGLNPDYKFYITNQIMKPILQVLALVVDQIKGYNKLHFQQEISKINMDPSLTNKRRDDKIQTLKERLVERLVFDKYIRQAQNKKKGAIHNYFQKVR